MPSLRTECLYHEGIFYTVANYCGQNMHVVYRKQRRRTSELEIDFWHFVDVKTKIPTYRSVYSL
jgi:hypothetical protein